MLVLLPIAEICPALAPDEVLLCGVRPVAELGQAWVWSKGGTEPRYRAFVDMIRNRFGAVEPMSCVFVIAGLPRRLFDAYALLPDAEVGFVEYRLPTLAAAAGLRLAEDDRFAVWRPADVTSGPPTRRQKYLNGARHSIHLPTVFRERRDRDGARVFHPYHGLYPFDTRAAIESVAWASYSAFRTARDALRARFAQLRRT
jgi:hypothetical protein